MTTTTTKYTFPGPSSRQGTAKKWLQRHLRKLATRQPDLGEGDNAGCIRKQTSLKRPRTAPSSATAGEATAPTVPFIPINIEQASPRPSVQPPLRPPRPNSGVMRDVNAWLDASMSTPSPPLMGGLSYWRTATVAGVKDSAVIQHAIPIVRAPEADRPSTSHSQQVKSLRRRAKKMQVQMPSLLRTKSQRPTGRKQVNRRSASMPLLSIPYEEARQAAPPALMTRPRSFLRPATRPSTAHASLRSRDPSSAYQQSLEHLPPQHGTPASARLGGMKSTTERRMNALFAPTTRSADSTRPSTAAAGLSREDSMGDLSDVPTYWSGPPPPSYRSCAASILTMSSFGCIDGMNPAQRQISQQRAAMRRGMRGKLKKFAQNFTT